MTCEDRLAKIADLLSQGGHDIHEYRCEGDYSWSEKEDCDCLFGVFRKVVAE